VGLPVLRALREPASSQKPEQRAWRPAGGTGGPLSGSVPAAEAVQGLVNGAEAVDDFL
jgi:hypothetical protein